MPSRLAGCLVAFLVLATGCSMGSAIPEPQPSTTLSVGPQPSPAGPATELELAEDTCWSAELLGSDPQRTLALANTLGISYFDAAYAIKDRPALQELQSCADDHAIEVYRLVPSSAITPSVTDYAMLMRTNGLDYSQLSAAVSKACMDPVLAAAAARSGVAGASLQPALPNGIRVGWTPATLEQWNRGQRDFACTLTQDVPSPLRYADLRTSAFPTAARTCIASGTRVYVDCARAHDRERIAVLDVSGAVAAGTFPGRSLLRRAAGGVYLDVDAAFYRPLDRACTAYLREVSTERRLSGVAEIDIRAWPDRDGVYAVSCEADAPADEASKVTQGSVYDR